MESQNKYLRFALGYRIEHLVVVTSFTILAVTGMVQKFATVGISIWLIKLMGDIERVRMIHHVAGIVLILESIYHLGVMGYNLIVKRHKLDLLPTFQDAKNAFQTIQFNLGLRRERPLQGRYTFDEKFEYFGIVWGTIVMALTGFILWNPIASTTILPGEFVPAAKALHSGEALLAVLSILVWHMYHVHISHFNKSMFTGYLDKKEMEEFHALELENIEGNPSSVDDPNRPKRRRVFLIGYGIFTIFMLGLTYVFITFEQTAIDTVEPVEAITAFVPQDAPQTVLVSFDSPMTSWEDGVGQFFTTRCNFCHGGTIPLSGLDLTNYDAAMLGGSSIPAITPGDPDNSGIIKQFEDGNHAVALNDDEMAKLVAWIEAGAP